MSQSNAAAIRRRVNQATLASPGSSPGTGSGAGSGAGAGAGPAVQTSNGPGFTLPQVIAVIDKRLTQLEAFMKDAKSESSSGRNVTFEVDNSRAASATTLDAVPAEAFNDMVAEFNNRFEILAVELASLKDTIIKLQTYTMDVNKMLVEERVQVFSDLGADNSTQTLTTTGDVEQGQEVSMNSVDLKDLVSAELSAL
jgi:hypothetical protein